MGIIRGGLLVIVSILLFFAFLIGNSFLTFGLSLSYDNIRPELVDLSKNLIEEQVGQDFNEAIGKYQTEFEKYCANNSEYVFNEGGQTFVVPCDSINQSSEMFIENSLSGLVSNLYYQEYNCDFWDCFEQITPPVFLISKKAKDYWMAKFYLALFFVFILASLMCLLVEKKTNMPIIAGSLLIVSSLPFLKMDDISSFFVEESLLRFFVILISKVSTIFWISFILGIFVLALGIGCKIFGISLQFSDFLSRRKSKKEE